MIFEIYNFKYLYGNNVDRGQITKNESKIIFKINFSLKIWLQRSKYIYIYKIIGFLLNNTNHTKYIDFNRKSTNYWEINQLQNRIRINFDYWTKYLRTNFYII